MDSSLMHPIGVDTSPSYHLPDCTTLSSSTTVLCISSNGSNSMPTGSDGLHDAGDHLEKAPQMTQWVLFRVGVLALIGGASLIANAMALASIFRMRQRRMSSHSSTLYTILAHMAVADLLVTSFCIVAEAAWTYTVEWLADELMCKFVKYAQVFALYLSTFILLVLALDQLLIVRYPLRRDSNIVLIRKSIFVAWFLAAVLSLPQVFIFRVVRGPFEEEFYQCVTYGFYTAPWQEQLYASVSLLLMFILPLTTLVATYAATFHTIARGVVGSGASKRGVVLTSRPDGSMTRSACVGHPMEATRRRLLAKAKKKSLMITIVIVTAFVICWTPYYAMMVIFIFDLDPDQQITGDLSSAIFFFGSSTAMINPVIYGAFHLRRPRSSKLHQSTIVLSSSIVRHPSKTAPHISSNSEERHINQNRGSDLKSASYVRDVQSAPITR